MQSGMIQADLIFFATDSDLEGQFAKKPYRASASKQGKALVFTEGGGMQSGMIQADLILFAKIVISYVLF